MVSIARSIAAVRAEIAAACQRSGRDPAGIRLIAVTKSQDQSVLPALAAAGITDFGENRVDHLALMAGAALASAPGLRFHHIGRVQGRQFPDILRWAGCLHGLCEVEHLPRLARAAAAAGYGPNRPFPVFIQVNTSGEISKAGLGPAALESFLDLARRITTLHIEGLMTMAPEAEGGVASDTIRSCFVRCRELAKTHGLPRLSMGMSGDFIAAVEEGATDLRIGTRLFVDGAG
ncbi:YggS family pyridoxal phosphate enzyme [Planctomycetota bacterium]|nr:YggS family pyridoxal phosphate enzyme [Planctomycetota bacterium]